MDIKETNILGQHVSKHWYYRAKARAMLMTLHNKVPSVILDVGAGSGFFSRYLLEHSSAEEAWCVDNSYDEEFGDHHAHKKIQFKRSIDSIDAGLVLFMDVLEHVDDDVALLREYSGKVPRGSQFLISVPAFEFLWSRHDVFLEHKRRYSLDHLRKTVASAGLEVKDGFYYFGIVFPLAASLRLARNWCLSEAPPQSELTRHHPLVNGVLSALCHSELYFMKLNHLFGLTVFCLAENR